MSGAPDLRTYPAPSAPHLMRQTWHDLCFMHWQVDPDRLTRLLPSGLELDLYQGRAYLAVVPFWMDRIAFWGGLPAFGMRRFAELNVRTYVRHRGKAGVWFFSLDAESRLAVRGARLTYRLPYFDAEMRHQEADGRHFYRSDRTHSGAPLAALRCSYQPIGEPFAAERNSLEDFLTSRYCLYAANRRLDILVGEIDHAPWPLQRAQVSIDLNSMTDWLGFELSDEPDHVLFSRAIDVRVWPVRRA